MKYTFSSLEIFAVIIILVLFITGLTRKHKDTLWLKGLVISYMLLLITDAIAWLIEGVEGYEWLYKFCWLTYTVYMSGCVIFFHEHVIYYLKDKISRKRRLFYYYCEVLMGITSILWLSSYFTNFLYTYNGIEFIYTDYYYILDIIFALIVILDSIMIIANWKKLGGRKAIAFSLYLILPLLAIPFSIKYDASIFSVLITSISIVIIYTVTSLEAFSDLALREAEIAEKNIDLADKQFRLISSQIQPHFLYNVLNTIYYLIDEDTEKGKKAIVDFSDYMRMNLDSIGKPMLIDFEEEMKKTEIYLSLEKLRFEDELEFEFDIKEKNFKLPQLTIQPLIENAVKHGICKKKNGGKVVIYTRRMDKYIEIGVIDNGVGFDSNTPLSNEKSHIGLTNIIYRVENMCNGKVEVKSKINEGTQIIIKIPLEDK